MSRAERQGLTGKADGLRLFALGRIPRCGRCPRYRGLSRGRDRTALRLESLPAVPDFCTYQLGAPLVTRYEASLASRETTSILHGLRMAGGRR